MDSSKVEYVKVDASVGSINDTKENEEEYNRENVVGRFIPRDNTFFRDIVCLIVWSIACCFVCPCLAWISLKVNQDAVDAYWAGDYHNAAQKQSCAIKWV